MPAQPTIQRHEKPLFPGFAVYNARRYIGKLLRGGSLGLTLAVLAGCPGESSNVRAPEGGATNALSGTVTAGRAAVILQSPGDVQPLTARGVAGLQRSVFPLSSSGPFTISLQELSGPYALRATYTEESTGTAFSLYSTATKAGTSNITPLTTLLVAQLTAQPPSAFFNSLSSSGIGASVTDANIRAAQSSVTAYLQDILGVEVRSGTSSFVESPFTPAAGDPMFDTIVALNTKLAERGSNIETLASEIAVEASNCRTESLQVNASGHASAFCPSSKSAEADSGDNTVTIHTFTAASGETLTLRSRDSSVLSAEYRSRNATSFICIGNACAAITLGTPAGDLTRPVQFNAVSLAAGAATATLNGTLTSAVPGVVLPPLPCTSNRYFLVKPDRSVIAACVDADPVGIGLPGPDAQSRGLSRLAWTFRDSSGTFAPQQIEVALEGDTVISVLTWEFDTVTNQPKGLYKCRRSDCNGVTLGAPIVDSTTIGIPVTLRTIALNDTQLKEVNPDGSLSSTSVALLKASFDTLLIFPTEPINNLACDGSGNKVVVQVSGTTPAFDACPPADPQGFSGFVSAGTEANGDISASIRYLSVTANGSTLVDGVTIRFDGLGTVVDVQFVSHYNDRFQCSGAACSGVAVSPPDGLGQRTITFSNTVLQELETGALLGDRTATLNGSFVAPAP